MVHVEQFVDSTVVIPMTGPENDDMEHYDEEDYEKMWSYYQQPSQGAMILSDNNDCTIKWFHCNCLCIRKPLNGK